MNEALDQGHEPFSDPTPTTPLLPRISVVVVTRDRAEHLPLLFRALENQTINGAMQWEFILVDNGSRDRTEQLTRAFAAASRFPVVYLFEGCRGRSKGLNAAIAKARGSILCFTDDDGVPAPNWLEAILRHYTHHPEIACVGGRVELYDAADAPVTVRRSKKPELIDRSTFSVSNVPVIGCNMAVDAATLRAAGFFDVEFGPGSIVGSGDDADMLYRLVRAGHTIRYDPDVLVFHNHGRRTPEAVAALGARYTVGRGGLYCKHLLQRDAAMLRRAYWEIRALVLTGIRGALLTRQSRSALRSMRLLMAGAIRYLRHHERFDGRNPS